MGRILVVDDDEAVRKLVRFRLGGSYDVVDTASPEEALALALQHKPDAILLDLQMPKFSGFELCQTLSSLSFTQLIPIMIISGEPETQARDFCQSLGARAYFQKPIDFEALGAQLSAMLGGQKPERRKEVRVRLRVPLLLRGRDSDGNPFESLTHTDNVSRSGFLCECAFSLDTGSAVEVFHVQANSEYTGRAQAVRIEWPGTPGQRYGFRFVEKAGRWVLD